MKTDGPLAAGLLLVLAGSLWGLALRHRAESRNGAVEIIVESSAAEAAAGAGGLRAAYRRLAAAGATGVAVPSLSGQDLAELGEAVLRPRGDRFELVATGRYSGPLSASAQAAGLEASWTGGTCTVLGEAARLGSLLVGIDVRHTEAATAAGLTVVARIGNAPAVGEAEVRRLLAAARRAGASAYLASGDAVLGYRSLVPATADAVLSLGMLYYSPEFAKIAGDAALARACSPSVVRLHAVQQAELDRMAPSAAVERYGKAVRERNVRALLVRFPDLVGTGPGDGAEAFLRQIRSELAGRGFAPKRARAMEDPGVPPLARLLAGCGLGLVAGWALRALVPRTGWAGYALCPVLGAAAWLGPGREAAAFLGAVAAPVAAQVWLQRGRFRPGAGIAAAFGIPLVGGLGVACMLSDLPHMLSLEVFPGVKAAQALPILAAAWLAASGQGGAKALAGRGVTWGSASAAVGALGALALLLARTGNDNPAAVSGWELQFRSLLDSVLYTRPRTKEFLVGNPALVLACLAAPRSTGNGWAGALFVLGAVGQTSIVNTLCHFHTPILLSVARIVIGIVLGGMLGLALWSLGRRWLPAGPGAA
jgi:hypothetical protein